MTTSQRRYLYFTVFVSGMTSLAIELSAARLLGNVFGTSNIVWACIIGLILIYLTLGYYLGGIVADRKPRFYFLYKVIVIAALATCIVPVIARPVLRVAADAFDQLSLGILFGSFVAVLILFIVPVTLLGTVSPFAIRLLVQNQKQAGEIAGRVYAVSTLGSFIGTFTPVLLLIPLVGTVRTFLIFGLLLLVVSLIGIYQIAGFKVFLTWLWTLLIFMLLYMIGMKGTIKNTSGQIFETESSYNYIQVIEEDGFRYLRLNEGQGIHSMWHPNIIDYRGPWEEFLVAPFFNLGTVSAPFTPERIKSIAIIGLAAGTTARQATAVFGNVIIDGFEIDPVIIKVGKKYFDMNLPNLNAIAKDGRWGLEHSPRQYSLIEIDAYRPPYIPWYLTTQEFFSIVRDRLEPNGTMVINVGRAPTDRRLVDGLVGTIQTIFPSIYIVDVPDTYNSVIFATKQPTAIENLYKNYLYLLSLGDVHPLLINAIERMIVYQQTIPITKVVFTDDKAPIEWITNNLVLNFVISSELEKNK